jgi:hypothetical protein
MVALRRLAVALLFVAPIALTSAARADDTYNFSFTPISGSRVSASGSFTLANDGFITSVNALMNGGGADLVLNVSHPASYITYGNFYAYFMNSNGLNTSQLTLSGTLTSTSGGLSGVVWAGGSNIGANGFFDAVLSSGAGGGTSSSGGAPSPEVNAGIGILLAGATFAFLRRKRGARHKVRAA